MDKLVLVGDSIRLNSEQYVKRAIASSYELSSPDENCESSAKVLQNMKQWVLDDRPDVVHINCGLHDLRYNPGDQTPVNNINAYAQNIDGIFRLLKSTNARLIWATCTPIDEVRHEFNKESRRYQKDVVLYNDVAVGIAKSYGATINDLYAYLYGHNISELLLDDGVHFNDKGNYLIGREIARVILS